MEMFQDVLNHYGDYDSLFRHVLPYEGVTSLTLPL